MCLYEKALAYATEAHTGQVRKYTGEPYINHPLEVVDILARHGHWEPHVKAAAILHDVVEDTPATFEEILREFGHQVFEYVFWLTDVSKPADGNRATRKLIDRIHVANAPHFEIQAIKCADLISNTRTIVQHDHGFAKVYLEEKRALLDLFKRVLVHNTSIYKEAVELTRPTGL